MTLQSRVQDIVESGQNSGTTKTFELVSDVIAAISLHYAIPVKELADVVALELARIDERTRTIL